MADISELQLMIRRAKKEIESSLPDLATMNAINGKALAERKIREVGFGAKYSDRRVPAWYFIGSWKSKAGEDFIKNKEAYDEKNAKVIDGEKVYAEDAGIKWSELRKAEGLQNDHVDLGFTNKMWAGLAPQPPYYENGKIVCKLSGNTIEVINKLTWNFQRYGDFFAKVLGPTEIEAMTKAIVEKIRVILINNGFKQS